MSDEKMRILEMIQSGQITAAEGRDLLSALDDSETAKPAGLGAVPDGNRYLRVRVTTGDHTKVNINVPLRLLKVAGKLADVAVKCIPAQARREMQDKGVDLSDINFDELVEAIDNGLVDGKLVDIDTDDPQEGPTKVEVYVE